MKIRRFITVVMISAALTACGSKETASPVTAIETTIQEAGTTVVEEEEEEEEEKIDNFSVDAGEVKAFAEKIKAAVAAKDIEALADLTAFPVYVGIVGVVENREAFIALGAEKVFSPDLTESVEGADTSDLSPSMAGFSVSKDGKANIIFGIVEGKLAISGINYES